MTAASFNGLSKIKHVRAYTVRGGGAASGSIFP